MKVKIKSLGLPKAAYGQQVNYGLSLGSGMQGDPSGSLKPKRTIGGVPREEANLEAEGGETVVGQISGDGIVDHMTIKGPRHSNGGVPMNLPDDSFIFSDTKSMKIKDPQILQMFGKTKGSYTPAELAKPYDISKYKAILMDPDTDRLSRNTAEIMIKNVVMKLGALALAQEAKKGFPQGIPEICKPYMEANGISEEDLIPELKAQAEQMQAMQQQQAMQMQQAQGMQQPQMQQQGMPPMMPDGQPAAMPQQGMVPPEQPMMDPRQMMAMQQEQQMMPPQPQQGMPMADSGRIVDGSVNEPIPGQFPMTREEAEKAESRQGYKDAMFTKDNRIFNDVFRDSAKEQDRTGLGSPTPPVLSRPTQNFTPSEQLEQLQDYRSPISSVARQEAARLQQSAASAAAQPISRVLTRNSYGGTPMAAYGMQKFAPGGEPCPPGMYYHPTEGCIPFISPSLDTPDWTDDYKRSNRVIKSIQNVYNPSLNTPLLRQKYKDNNAEYPQEWDDENFIGPSNEIDEDSLRRMKELQGYDIEKLMRKMEEVGMPPEFLPNMLDRMEEYVPKKFEEDPNVIRFHDSKNDPKKEILDKLNQEYEESVKDCPCRQKVIVQGVEKEKCVPCESQSMAAYGMQLGGYDMPFIMGTGGMMRYDHGGPHNGVTVNDIDSHITNQADLQKKIEEEGYTAGQSSINTEGAYKITEEGVVIPALTEPQTQTSLSTEDWVDSLCASLGPGGAYDGSTFQQLQDAKTVLDPRDPKYAEYAEILKNCANVKTSRHAVHIEAVENPTEGTCVCADKDGNPFPGHTPMSYEEILASGKIEGYTVEQKCQGFKEAFCTETETTTELDPPIRPEKMDLMPLPAEISMSRGVADINPTTLDIIPTGERNYLDYRTAAQNDANAREQQIASIKTMPGVSIGQKQAMIAQVNSQDKSASIVTDVYNKNVATANELAKSDEAQAMRTQALQADLDSNYNQAVANAENQRTLNVNAIRDRRQRRGDDMYKMEVMKTSLENAAENYDWMGNFTGGTENQKRTFMQCINAGNSPAACAEKYLPKPSATNVATNTTTPPAEPTPEPEPAAGTARYGRIVNPYIMASSVYPFNK